MNPNPELLLLALAISTALTLPSSSSINSNSVLVALLDSSHYTDLAELIEKALLLQTLEETISSNNLTIFAPRNEALERNLDPEFRRFLLQPANLRSLQSLILHHIIPSRIHSNSWPHSLSVHITLSEDEIRIDPVDVLRPDGIIHGIRTIWIPRSVQEDFNRRRSLADIAAVLPTGAPEVDPRTHRLEKPAPVPTGSPPV